MHHRGVGYRSLRMAKFHQRINHHSEHHHRNGDTHPENFHVQGVDVPAQLGDADRHPRAARMSALAQARPFGREMLSSWSPLVTLIKTDPLKFYRFQVAATRSSRLPSNVNALPGDSDLPR